MSMQRQTYLSAVVHFSFAAQRRSAAHKTAGLGEGAAGIPARSTHYHLAGRSHDARSRFVPRD